MSKRVMEKFWAQVQRGAGCWEWQGAVSSQGYGRYGKPQMQAHRISYEALVGPIPPGLVLDHLCRNHRCVNPAHLDPVSQKENLRRGIRRTRQMMQTHCIHGHPLSGDNLRIYPGTGKRACKECTKARKKAWRARRRAATPAGPRHHSEETKQKLRTIAMGRVISEETRRKMSNAHLKRNRSAQP
jgi:hypothetical protein